MKENKKKHYDETPVIPKDAIHNVDIDKGHKRTDMGGATSQPAKAAEAKAIAETDIKRFDLSSQLFFEELGEHLNILRGKHRLPHQMHKAPHWAKKDNPKQDAAIKIIISKEDS